MLKDIVSPKQFTGWHMLMVLVLFFGTIITVNLTLAYYANTTWTGLVVKNSYVASQHFDKDLKEKRRQNAMGWDAQSSYVDGRFTVALEDDSKNKVTNTTTTVKLGRPARENDDRILVLQEQKPGEYAVDTDLAPGIWQADLTVSNPAGLVWTKSLRFVVKG